MMIDIDDYLLLPIFQNLDHREEEDFLERIDTLTDIIDYVSNIQDQEH